jgi:hypothetical protein
MRVILGAFRTHRLAAGDELVVDYARHSLSRNGRAVILPPLFFRVIAAIVASGAAGAASDDLVRLTYAERADGGPPTAPHIIRDAIYAGRRQLAAIGVRIVSDRGRPRVYEVIAADHGQARAA